MTELEKAIARLYTNAYRQAVDEGYTPAIAKVRAVRSVTEELSQTAKKRVTAPQVQKVLEGLARRGASAASS